jgi:tRNA uridine 5-carbamoylmethylation protein Kti12
MTVVLLDDNFYYKSMRKRFRPDAIIHLNTPIDVCFLRNRTRSSDVPDHVIEQMALQLEVPKDGVDHPVLFVDPYPSEDIEALADRILAIKSFWERSIQSKPHSVAECMNHITLRDQVLNTMETRLRKCVSEIASKNVLDKAMNRKISELKREIMRNFKYQYTTVDNHEGLLDIMDSQCDLFIREICSFQLSYIISLFYCSTISF